MGDVSIDRDSMRKVRGCLDFLHPHMWSMSQRLNKDTIQRQDTHHPEWSAQSDPREGDLPLVLSCLSYEAVGPLNHQGWYCAIFGHGLPTTIPVFESRSFE